MPDKKLALLLQGLKELESAVVAFSGGVDSAFLAAAAKRALGDTAVAVTACSETLPDSERTESARIAEAIGIRHVFLPISELTSPEFVANTPERCYYCKKVRFSAIRRWADSQGIRWVLDGSNFDDASDYRPGMKAISELEGVQSPLLTFGFTKDEIRAVSREWELPTWNKLSAACLSSRVAYGLAVTPERLKQIEQAEAFIKTFFQGQIRVRHHGNLARIEVAPAGIPILTADGNSVQISRFLRSLGFQYVTLDLTGYRTGSMNEVLDFS
ncbi:MAG TPA: ATP-dependent sacrificial sulfur transferase LarE [Methylomusa anaerophila]|uniref:NAD synthetase n=1 Tax=Methylomusa anaerophila TaxID=1930071 RepID=A0A348AQX3_9FIRM|nr:ATP-dependent sacrificial sulfur transferase LarE [Methylomusa anaerophila]BBB93471.1 NAD synthetase [Methylomusa anaerophila]HML90589.1 ATP-dependent sacrificial sulfur transferase LarE [Methylomusa anaerophila]